jgi:hypothetical protein
MKIVNLTPHPLVLVGRTIESSGIARCEQVDREIGDVDGIPVVRSHFGAVGGLPEPEYGTIYVVSSITAAAVPEREDVFVPARPVRDEQGRIVGSMALATLHRKPLRMEWTCPYGCTFPCECDGGLYAGRWGK